MMRTAAPVNDPVPRRRPPQAGSATSAVSAPAVALPDETVLRQFLRRAGGESAVIAILSCAATNPAGTGEAYARRFRELGAREATTVVTVAASIELTIEVTATDQADADASDNRVVTTITVQAP